MICNKCKTSFDGDVCPQCGNTSTNKLYQKMKSYMYSDKENIMAVLGNNVAKTFISTGVLGKGFAILSDKRVYFKGKCLIRRGKGFYKKTEEKSVDIKDVTGTGFIHNKATWAKVISIIFFIFGFNSLTILLQGYIFGILGTLVFGGLGFLFNYLYKVYNCSVFQISYAGGEIAFDMHYIDESETKEFQKQLNLLKDKVSANIETDVIYEQEKKHEQKIYSAPEQLKEFKELLDGGIITQEEFDIKKKQILGL